MFLPTSLFILGSFFDRRAFGLDGGCSRTMIAFRFVESRLSFSDHPFAPLALLGFRASFQVGRKLSEDEVLQINYITKRRAFRYIAAAEREWLYPERRVSTDHWKKLGDGLLLMPEPRLSGGRSRDLPPRS